MANILKQILATLNGEEFDDDVITEEGVLLHFGAIAGDASVPDGVTAIANGAFRDCPELMELYIPHSVKHIADHAFDGIFAMLAYDGTVAEWHAIYPPNDRMVTCNDGDVTPLVIESFLNSGRELATLGSIQGKSICLTGNFSHGFKSKVEAYITERGGTIAKGVTKDLDILIVGQPEVEVLLCNPSYVYGYSAKLKKALAHNKQGRHILILTENDFFNAIK